MSLPRPRSYSELQLALADAEIRIIQLRESNMAALETSARLEKSLKEEHEALDAFTQKLALVQKELADVTRERDKFLQRVTELREALVKVRDVSPSVAIAEATARVALGFDGFSAEKPS